MSQGYHLMLGQSLAAPLPSIYGGTAVTTGHVTEKNPKSQLLEFFQKKQGTPQFTITALSKPPADPSFRSVVVCPKVPTLYGPEREVPETAFEGTGRSKKLAEQDACLQALEFYRSKRLIGSLVLPPSSPVPPPAPMTAATVYAQATTTPLPPAPPGSEIYIQPVMPNSMGPTAVVVQPATLAASMDRPPQQHYQPSVGNNSDGVLTASQVGHDDEDDDDAFSVDNSDYDTRKQAILGSTDLAVVQDLALAALDEILQLRQELFGAKMTISRRVRKARRIAKAVDELTKEPE